MGDDEGVPAYLGLGSNMGDRLANLRFGMNGLLNTRRVNLVEISSVYETEPVGGPEQDPYLNAVAHLSVRLDPLELLALAAEIEKKAGRVRVERWGPRPLDIDLLAVGDLDFTDEKLTLPHPRLYEREFVLVPLFEVGISPGSSIDFEKAAAALESIRGTQGVKQYEPASWL